MYNHEPPNYECPFCQLVAGDVTRSSSQDDVVYRDDDVTAFMSVSWWPNNPGHVLVVPNQHIENVYDLPAELGTPLQRAVRAVAIALRATYGCTGISTRQHNEPDGMQHVWHYHVHVFPRYANDDLYLFPSARSTPEDRLPYAEKLRRFLRDQHLTGPDARPRQRHTMTRPGDRLRCDAGVRGLGGHHPPAHENGRAGSVES